ncbi:UNVERIFIED_CONTAM: hypothetical protein RMT77_006729 [Armadillidium vulgare]
MSSTNYLVDRLPREIDDNISSNWTQRELERNFSCQQLSNFSELELFYCNGSMIFLNDSITSSIPANVYYFYETVQFSVMWFLFFSIVIGNTSVIAALILSKARKSRTNYFIMHLAIADLLVGLLSVLTDIIWKITVSWNAGNILCKVVKFALGLVTYSSTYVLVALSIDRYDAITHPMNFSGSWRRARYLVKAAWILSGVFATPSIYLFGEKEVKGLPQCWMDLDDWQWQTYFTIVTFLVFVIPFFIITGCYLIIVYTIWSKSKIMTISERNVTQNGEKGSTNPQADDDSRRASSRGLIPKAKIKTVKMTFVIVFVFVLCWSPYFVFNMLHVYHFIPENNTTIALSTFIQSLAPLNSAANPLIYCLFSTHLCRNLRKIKGLDVLARVLCPFSTCTKQQYDSQGQIPRSGTDYTTMSEISSKRQTISSVRLTYRYTRVRSPNPSRTMTKKPQGEVLDIQLLNPGHETNFRRNDERVEGSSV